MFSLACRLWAFRHLFIPTSLTLPDWKDRVWISGALINRPIRRNNFTPTIRTQSPTRRSGLNIEGERIIVAHFLLPRDVSPSTMLRRRATKSVQKIATGGTSNTKTQILNCLMNNALWEPARDARHMPHCATADVSASSQAAMIVAASTISLVVEKRISDSRHQLP